MLCHLDQFCATPAVAIGQVGGGMNQGVNYARKMCWHCAGVGSEPRPPRRAVLRRAARMLARAQRQTPPR
eukprot:12511371-Alexandrium_andersonii.AAC.1